MGAPLLAALLAGCAAPGGPVDGFPIEVELSAVIPTVPTVRVDPAEVGAELLAAWVEWGPGQEWSGRVAIPQGEEGWTSPVLGMKPDAVHSLRVVVQTAAGEATSEVVEVHTGARPAALPAFEVEAAGPVEPGFLVTALVAASTAVILDRDGDVVWWYTDPAVQLMGRVALSRDGRGVWMGAINLDGQQDATLTWVSLDGTRQEVLATPWRHHDFVEHEDGTLAWLAYAPALVEGRVVSGDSIVERAPDGELEVVYDVWQHHQPPDEGSGGLGGAAAGWPHANALDLVEGGYLVSFLYLGGVARVDRATGAELWFLGGPDSTLTTAAGQAPELHGTHGLELAGDALLVFENGQGSAGSSAVELALEPASERVDEVWRYTPDPTLASPVLGDVQRLDGERVLVTFSYSGEVREVDRDGQVWWRLSSALGAGLSYLSYTPALQPAAPP